MPPDLEDIDVDALMDEIKAPAEERQMTDGKAPDHEVADSTPAAWDGKPWEFDWNGKKVMPDSQDKAKTWMSLGYNASQRMGEFNKKEAAWALERKELSGFKEKFGKYSKVDEFASTNPDWWKHVEDSWASRELPQGIDPNLAKVLTPIQQQLEAMRAEREQERAALAQEKLQETVKKEDETLEKEIGSIRSQYPNIDLTVKDESGETLERRVIKHCVEIGTTSFRAGFRDYLHDQLVTNAQANGREAIAKDTQLKAKKGILGTTQAPLKGPQRAENVRGKSWNDLGKEAKRELGII